VQAGKLATQQPHWQASAWPVENVVLTEVFGRVTGCRISVNEHVSTMETTRRLFDRKMGDKKIRTESKCALKTLEIAVPIQCYFPSSIFLSSIFLFGKEQACRDGVLHALPKNATENLEET